MDHQDAVTEAELPYAQQRSEVMTVKKFKKIVYVLERSEELAELTSDVAEGLVRKTSDAAEELEGSAPGGAV